MVVQRAVVRILVMLAAATAGITSAGTATAATALVGASRPAAATVRAAGTPAAVPIRLAPGDVVLYPGYKLVRGRYDCYLAGTAFYNFSLDLTSPTMYAYPPGQSSPFGGGETGAYAVDTGTGAMRFLTGPAAKDFVRATATRASENTQMYFTTTYPKGISSCFLRFSVSDPIPAQPPGTPSSLTVLTHAGRVVLGWPAAPGATSYVITRGSLQVEVTGTGWTDTFVSPRQQYLYAVRAKNASGESGNVTAWASTGFESADRAYVATKAGPALCGRAGSAADQRLVCTVKTASGWVASTSPPSGDWGYGPDRAWVANVDGTLSYCARVGAGNQVRCDTFDGANWTSAISPPTDAGYPDSF